MIVGLSGSPQRGHPWVATPQGVSDTRRLARDSERRGWRPTPTLAIALLALFAAIAGGSAIALRHHNAAPLHWHPVKANPHTDTDPCGAGKTGVFCGAGYGGGFCSIANYGNGFEKAAYAKGDDGIVHLRGSVAPEAGCGYGLGPFVLPKGYRPVKEEVFAQSCVLASSTSATCSIFVPPNGAISFDDSSANSGFSMDGISFAAR